MKNIRKFTISICSIAFLFTNTVINNRGFTNITCADDFYAETKSLDLTGTSSSVIKVPANASSFNAIVKLRNKITDEIAYIGVEKESTKSDEDVPPVDENYRYAQHFVPIVVAPITELYGREDDFICGMDVSSLWAVVQSGGQYFDMDGKKLIEGDEISNALAIMKKYGTNWIRLRLWNNPRPQYPVGLGAGGLNDKDVDLIIAKKAKALGLKVLLVFHYSDTWADPTNQIKPEAWTDIETIEELSDEVYTFTKEVLQEFVDEDCMPEMIQIGNEISRGFMYHEMKNDDSGTWQTTPSNKPSGAIEKEAEHISLVKSGIQAVRDVDPNNDNTLKRAKVIYHLAHGGRLSDFIERAQLLARNNIDYDVMGASYYPFWHGTLTELEMTLTEVARIYGKAVIVAETGWGYTYDSTKPFDTGPDIQNIYNISFSDKNSYETSVQGQADELRAVSQVVAKVKDNKGMGVFVWEPAWIPTPQMGSGWEAGTSGLSWANQAYFDYLGRAMPSLGVWKRLFPDSPVVTPIITKLNNVEISTTQESMPLLPETIKAIYSNGVTKEEPVIWDGIDQTQINIPNTFTILGTVDNTILRAKAIITVQATQPNLVINHDFAKEGVWFYGDGVTRLDKLSEAYTGRYVANYWYEGLNNSEGETYQTVIDIAPGNYTLSCWIQGDKYGDSGVLELFIETGGERYTLPISGLGGYLNWFNPILADVPITNGTAKIGLKCTRGNNAWLTFDNFSLTYSSSIE